MNDTILHPHGCQFCFIYSKMRERVANSMLSIEMRERGFPILCYLSKCVCEREGRREGDSSLQFYVLCIDVIVL